jgi:hypothetical protein
MQRLSTAAPRLEAPFTTHHFRFFGQLGQEASEDEVEALASSARPDAAGGAPQTLVGKRRRAAAPERSLSPSGHYAFISRFLFVWSLLSNTQ